jgi:type II secretory pathway pseudopilin PulG
VAFTLVELLAVMAIIVIMTSLCVPVMHSIAGSGQTDAAITRLTGTYELARAYAMSNHTYVRVGLANVNVQAGISQPTVVVIVIASNDGTLTNNSAQNMATSQYWSAIGTPLILSNLWNYDSLNTSAAAISAQPPLAADTSSDLVPSSTDIGSPGFTRTNGPLSSLPSPPTFTAIVQFDPAGEARVLQAQTAHYIKVGLDQPSSAPTSSSSQGWQNKNPFILRISGINGSVSILRKETLN